MRVSRLATFLLAAVLPALTPTVAPVAAQSRDIGTYALFAGSKLRANGLVVTMGDVGVNAGQLFARRPIDAPASQLVADVLRIAATSSCSALFANTVVGTVPGCAPVEPFAPPILPDLQAACGTPATPAPCDAASPITVEHGETLPLVPGAYGDVLVLGGGDGPGTLVLQGGDYSFCALRLARGGRAVAAAPAAVHVEGALALSTASVTGPADGGGVMPTDLRVFASGPRARVARNAVLRALLCAPSATLSIGHGAVLEGRFAADAIRVGRATVTGIVVPTTTTTLPASCGNGLVEAGEECDPPGSLDCPGSAACDGDCQCPGFPPTSSTSTTTTTLIVCGDGVVSGPEECDPAAGAGCQAGETCGAAGEPDACTCVPSTLEVCGNCLDDDGNGLVDFEDAACCGVSRRFAMQLQRGRIKSRGLTTSKIALRATLARTGLDRVNPLREDVFVQVRPVGGSPLLCARLPAQSFRKKGSAFRFRDRKRSLASAAGLQSVVVKVRRDRSVGLLARGKRVRLRTPPAGAVELLVGFRSAAAGDSQNRCSAGVAAFRTGPHRQLIAP